MDVLVSGHEIDRISPVTQVLRTMTFKSITQGFCEHYALYKIFYDGNKMMRRTTEAGNVLYAYVNTKTKEYAKLPIWLADTIAGHERVTYIIGPWIFVNGFENTQEGKYLQRIFPYYFKMSEHTSKKVNMILTKYGWWVRIHKQYVDGINNSKLREVSDDIR